MSAQKAAFLFDLDGVLIDSETVYTRFWSGIDRIHPTGIPSFSTAIKGMTLTEIFNLYFPDPETRAEITRLLNQQEHDMTYEIKPGVQKMLSFLKKNGIPAVMVTSSNDMKMTQLWRQHPEFKEKFTDIVTADRITRSKPDPEGYLLGAALARTQIRHCAVFEDSAQGVAAGRAAGAYVVGIAGTLPAGRIAPYSDIVVDSLVGFDIPALLNILHNRS